MKLQKPQYFCLLTAALVSPARPSTWTAVTTSWGSSCWLLVAGFEGDFPVALAEALQFNVDVSFVAKPFELLAPLQQDQAALVAQIVDTECFELTIRIHAIEIDVVNGHARTLIFVYQSKGWAGNVVLRFCFKTLR